MIATTMASFAAFVASVAAAGCGTFVVHARKALLSGLSPKENREIPPLLYATVYRLKADFPALRIILNGGVDTLTAVGAHLAAGVDGVMVGRKAYADPYWLTDVESAFLDQTHTWQRPSRAAIVRAMAHYAAAGNARGCPPAPHHPAHAGPVSWAAGRAGLASFPQYPGLCDWMQARSC
jgi:tRNA-dihydrouridine synthase A